MSTGTDTESSRFRRRPRTFLAGAVVVLIGLFAAGGIAGDHYLHVRSVKKKEAAKQKAFDPKKLKEVTKKAVTGATTTVAPSGSSTTSTTVPPINLKTTPPGLKWTGTKEVVYYGGLKRSYEVFRPQGSYSKPLSVVVMLSGAAVTSKFEASRDQLISALPPSVVVFPGEADIKGDSNWNAGHCCGEAMSHNVDDVGFVNSVIADVERTPGVATNQVYLSGYSNGGKLAMLMACDFPKSYKGVATYGSVPSFTCPDWKPVPEMILAGTADPDLTIGPGGKNVVQYGFSEPKVSQVVASRLEANGCTSKTQSATSGDFTETRWIDCSSGSVALGIYDGRAHAWPPTTSTAPGASAVIADYFESLGL